jgi:CRISPR/Cas system-associated exonuclease Cas4 (RecB family)
MIIPLEDIKTYSTCPYAYNFSLKDKIITTLNPQTQILIKIIKKCYLRYAETNELITWRTIINWVDSIVFKDIDLTNINEYEKGRTLSEHILSPLRLWHQEIYREEECNGFVDVPLSSIIGGVEITGNIPLIKTTNPTTLTILSDINLSRIQVYNNLIYRGLACLLSKNINAENIKLQYLFLGKYEKFEYTEITITKKDNDIIEQIIGNIAQSIFKKITYPSITSACNQCPFKLKCSI